MDYRKLFEGKFTRSQDYTNLSMLEHCYFRMSPTTLVLRKMFKFLDAYVSTCHGRTLKILDLGCGGGIRDLTLRGRVYGVDVSRASLRQAERVYAETALSNAAKRIPYPNGYFDVVFCSEVYGHIKRKDKDSFLGETSRVLKRSGFFIFSCEVYGNNWLTRYLRKTGQYQQKWVDLHGHIGLEPAPRAVMRFKNFFSNVQFEPTNS